MARKKNLTSEDLEDASIYEDLKHDHQKNTTKLHNVQIQMKCLNKKQKDLKQAIEEKDIVVSTGAPGTGKTFLSLLTALHLMKSDTRYRKLILIKSLQVIKGEDVGYLPGSLLEKMMPYMYSYTGNLDKIFRSSSITKDLIENETIQILPIAYIRGVTMENCMLSGTTILMENDEVVNIENLYESFLESIDTSKKFLLKSINIETGLIEIKEMSMMSKNKIVSDEIFEIELADGKKIKLTGDHKLFVKNKGYTNVKDISENDILIGI